MVTSSIGSALGRYSFDNDLAKNLARILEPFDAGDLLKTFGALQLVPQNAERTLRLEFLAQVAVTLPGDPSRSLVSIPRLRQICNDRHLAGAIDSAEDPASGPVVDSVIFPGGPFRVFPGIAQESEYVFSRLAEAILLHSQPFPNAEYSRRCRERIASILALSDAVARRGDLNRSVFPISTTGRQVLIPGTERLRALKAAVAFSMPDLTAVLADHSVGPSALDYLSAAPGMLSLADVDLSDSPLFARPLVRTGDQLIVALPGLLLAAARNALIAMATGCGLVEELASRYNQAVWRSIGDSLRKLDHEQLRFPQRPLDFPGWKEGLFQFDTDKLLYVTLLTDPMGSYDAGTVFGKWEPPVDPSTLAARARAVIETAYRMPKAPNEVLWLVALQGVGRMGALSLPEVGVPVVTFSGAELETIADLEGGHPLALWKYARAVENLTSKTRTVVFDELDRFGLYRHNGDSFYLSDDFRPDALSITPDYSGPLRKEVAAKFDWHGVASWDGSALVKVGLLHGDRGIPVYVPQASTGKRVELLVAGFSIPVWIVGPEDVASGQLYRQFAQMADAIGYWLWQLKSVVQPVLAGVRVPIPVVISLHQLPTSVDSTDITIGVIPVAVDSEAGSSRLTLTFGSELGAALADSPDGERELIRVVLRGLETALGLKGSESLSGSAVEEALAKAGPSTIKRRLFVVQHGRRGVYDPKGLPRYRRVQKADLSEVFDLLGQELSPKWPVGVVAADSRILIVNEAVSALYRSLANEVRALKPKGLLESLVRFSDSLVQASGLHRIQIPYRLACFSSAPVLIDELKQEMPELATASLACRFLIEYVAARPPSGLRQFSLGVYDRLLALAASIVNFGFDSDFIKYELADLKVSMLGSGRLGIDRAAHRAAMDALLESLAAGEVQQAARLALRSGRSDPPSDVRLLADRINAASASEFGESLLDIVRFLGEASTLANENADYIATIPLAKATLALSARLGWQEERLRTLLARFCLTPRSDFLDPGSPFGRPDVYPWRFNRPLSYLRRPFIVRDSDSALELIWSGRQVLEAAEYLKGLCSGGRLKAATLEMRALMGEVNNLDGNRFTDDVAELLAGRPGHLVRRRVKKIGSRVLRDRAGDLGDIDVLSLDEGLRLLLLIECKDFAPARTPAEMHSELEKLVGREGHEKSVAGIQERRAAWMRENLQECFEWLGISRRKGWTIQPLIVVKQQLAVPFLRRLSVPVMTLGELREQEERSGQAHPGIRAGSV